MAPAPEGHKPNPPVTGAMIDGEKFRDGLFRIVQDPDLRARLEKEPLAMLPELGITVSKEKRAELANKSLADLMAMNMQRGQPDLRMPRPDWPSVFTATVIGVAIVAAI